MSQRRRRYLICGLSLPAFLFLAGLPSVALSGPLEVQLANDASSRAAAVSGNTAPVVIVPVEATTRDGALFHLTVTASDPDESDILTITPSGFPSGFNETQVSGASPLTVTVSGRLPFGTSASGPFEVTWSVSDDVNAPSTASTTVEVVETTIPDMPVSYGYVPGRVLVRFRPLIVESSPGPGVGTPADFTFASSVSLETLDAAGITSLSRLLPWFSHDSINAQDLSRTAIVLPEDLTDVYVAELADTNVIAAIAVLRADSVNIQTAEPDWFGRSNGGRNGLGVEAMQATPSARHTSQAASTTLPNDPLFAHQWWLRNTGQIRGIGVGQDIRASLAWDQTTGGAGAIQVGLLDTGIDASHPDLRFVVQGPNFITPNTSPEDDDPLSEGTANAGLVGGHGNNGIGVAGASWGPNLVAVKVADANGQTTESIVLQGVDWARQNLLPIVTANVHFINQSDNMASVFKNAHATGMLMLSGTGNDDVSAPYWPASYTRLTKGIGAIAETGLRWQNVTDPFCPTADGLGSPYGSQVALCAPGGNRIVTTSRVAVNSYYDWNGTCAIAYRAGTAGASAVAAGVAALVGSVALQLSGEDIGQILERTARDIGVQGRDDFYGYGCVDAAAAVGAVMGSNVIDRGIISGVTDLGRVDNPQIRFHDVPGYSNTLWCTFKHEVRANVQFTHPFVSPPTVWGRHANSVGWRSHQDQEQRYHLEEPVGWSEVVPGSVTRYGCTLRTYVYEVFSSNCLGGAQQWLPVAPNQVTLAWTAIGPASATGVVPTTAPAVLRVAATPNPVRAGGEFQISLPTASHITLRIFRADGTLAREVANGEYPAGIHHIPWSVFSDGRGRLAAGMYLYRLTTAQEARTGKIVVIR